MVQMPNVVMDKYVKLKRRPDESGSSFSVTSGYSLASPPPGQDFARSVFMQIAKDVKLETAKKINATNPETIDKDLRKFYDDLNQVFSDLYGTGGQGAFYLQVEDRYFQAAKNIEKVGKDKVRSEIQSLNEDLKTLQKANKQLVEQSTDLLMITDENIEKKLKSILMKDSKERTPAQSKAYFLGAFNSFKGGLFEVMNTYGLNRVNEAIQEIGIKSGSFVQTGGDDISFTVNEQSSSSRSKADLSFQMNNGSGFLGISVKAYLSSKAKSPSYKISDQLSLSMFQDQKENNYLGNVTYSIFRNMEGYTKKHLTAIYAEPLILGYANPAYLQLSIKKEGENIVPKLTFLYTALEKMADSIPSARIIDTQGKSLTDPENNLNPSNILQTAKLLLYGKLSYELEPIKKG